MSATYCDVMKRKPIWRAVNFDWNFLVEEGGPSRRTGILNERQIFKSMVEKLKFKIYPEDTKQTRNLSKKKFHEELMNFKNLCVEESCGCILVAVSSHGVILKTDTPPEEEVEVYEDYILTHPEPDRSSYSEGFKDERVTVREIVEVFRDKRLKGIPKIFFIQACRSKSEPGKKKEDIDLGIPFVVYDNEEKREGISHYLPRPPAENKIMYSPPCIDDSVIVFSTPLGYAAGFESRRGSHVWNVLANKLKNMSEPVKLLDLLKETNRELSHPQEPKNVKEIDGLEYKPLLSICYTLTKHIVFK